jgi:hypothetical protein
MENTDENRNVLLVSFKKVKVDDGFNNYLLKK